ncbi:transcriptional regulator, SarA/Rot family [Planococcus antarcticus]|uniref:transcriptional regulator, SarA/Rot family n=1 Tax=Planococcus antarcticus TaxID=161360 RepID=UPI0038B3DBE0
MGGRQAADQKNRCTIGSWHGNINPIINRMIEHGRLTKQQSEKDKREFVISLTEKARSEQIAVEQAVFEKVTAAIS